MFGSRARLADKRLRLRILEQAKKAARDGDMEKAAWFLGESRELSKHIREHNYAPDDKALLKREVVEKERKLFGKRMTQVSRELDEAFRICTDPWGEPMPW